MIDTQVGGPPVAAPSVLFHCRSYAAPLSRVTVGVVLPGTARSSMYPGAIEGAHTRPFALQNALAVAHPGAVAPAMPS